MANSISAVRQRRKDVAARSITEKLASVELGCGCVSVSRGGAVIRVHWCPHHLAIHGVLTQRKRDDRVAQTP